MRSQTDVTPHVWLGPSAAESVGLDLKGAGPLSDRAEGGSDDTDQADVVPREKYEAVCRRAAALEAERAIIASIVLPDLTDVVNSTSVGARQA